MKTFLALMALLASSVCFAVSWEEVSPDDANRIGLKLSVDSESSSGCHRVSAIVPNEVVFDELGKMELHKVQYIQLESKDQGWQLNPIGTRIKLPAEKGVVRDLCISTKNLPAAYISLLYTGPSGTPPMVLLLNLKQFFEAENA